MTYKERDLHEKGEKCSQTFLGKDINILKFELLKR